MNSTVYPRPESANKLAITQFLLNIIIIFIIAIVITIINEQTSS